MFVSVWCAMSWAHLEPMRCMHHVGPDHPVMQCMRVLLIGFASSVPRWVLAVGYYRLDKMQHTGPISQLWC